MLPKIALLGRPNVGKSTLFNRLIRSNRAITHDRPGVTRDRMEGVVRSRSGRSFTLIDTGGVTLDSHHSVADGPEGLRGFEAEILQQTQAAMDEASVFCLVVDGRDGLMPFDEHLASFVRRAGKPTLLVVNKVDGMEHEDTMLAEFHALGFPMLALSAEHGHNIRALEEEMVDLLPVEDPDAEAKPENVLRLAMLGRPNAGKSSLVNAMIGEDRMIVSDVAGTTRDSVDIPFVSDGRACEFVDTAGVRRRTRITDTVERFSVNSSLKTTTKADVTLYVIDALEGVTAQDKRLIDLLDERKTPFMILVNKIDLVGRKEQAALEKNFKEVLQFCPHVPVLMVSAMKQVGLGRIVPLAAFAAWKLRTRSEAFRLHLLFACGVFLAFSEVYKQLFLYYIENNRHYDWWYFPFQLCSLPMYLCLLLPFVPHKYQRIFCTFMYNYNLLGAVMVFVDPSGLMHPYWTLTLHGFIWHILLIFIGLLIAFSRMVLPTAKGFWQSTAVFTVGCVIATIINVTSHPYGNADMFYITPYYATTQIVYSQIAAKFGIFAGNAVYVLSIILGAWLLHLVFQVERP